ncbi:hypothetical protein [Hymenobacter fodinae]|uniref:Uncharacterized protein n=1 Tax=Hymenobacter fodinae TaxID=2510796 RepID=A0A4Z0PCQ1_9BACT|nr:hypothetical protein [Hymenobacter fodinae]TGE10232.1 hypothetical protein EU556_05280 [Hymenobacter fodinae]
MRTLYSYLLAGWLLCIGAAASAAPAYSLPDGPGKPTLVTTPPAVTSPVAQVDFIVAKAAAPTHPQKKKSSSKKVWLFVGIGVALAVLRILV